MVGDQGPYPDAYKANFIEMYYFTKHLLVYLTIPITLIIMYYSLGTTYTFLKQAFQWDILGWLFVYNSREL